MATPTLRSCDNSTAMQASIPVDAACPQRKRTTIKLHLEKKQIYGKGDVDSRIMQVEGWRKMEAAAQN